MVSSSKNNALIFALALSVATPARAADGADGQNGNGAGQPAINNQTPLQGGGGGDGTDGGKGGNGGIGALVTGGGLSENFSKIAGGLGGAGGDGVKGGVGGSGGAGIYLAASHAALTNRGVVIGGAGGRGGADAGGGGAGGSGIYFAGDGASFLNFGEVIGGDGGGGGLGGLGGDAGFGGLGVHFAGNGATFVNSGTVAGGLGGSGPHVSGEGGKAVFFAGNGATFVNTGAVVGGAGGEGQLVGSNGGDGVYFAGSDSVFVNSGRVRGGNAGNGPFSSVGGGGVYFAGTGVMLVNSGVVAGGAGGASPSPFGSWGGAGVYFSGSDSTFVNSGTVAGGAAAPRFTEEQALTGVGGTGVYFAGGSARFVNSGTVTGGSGFQTAAGSPRCRGEERCFGAAGGAGVNFARAGATLTNSGMLIGGSGGVGGPGGSPGLAGAGVIGNGLTVVNSGTISGGLSGDGETRGSAIIFASDSNVLESLTGSKIIGNINVNGASLTLKGVTRVQGDLTFKPGSTFIAQIGGAGASHFDLAGVARLDGTLIATAGFTPGSVSTRRYSLIHAAGGFANTRFAKTELNLSSLPPSLFSSGLSYGANDLSLNLTSFLGAGTRLNRNQQAVAGAINNAFNAGGVVSGNFSKLYWLNDGALPMTLTAMTGEAATGAQQTALRATEQFLLAMLDPTAAGREGTADAAGPELAFAPERAPLPESLALAYARVLKGPTVPATMIYQPRWTSWASAFGGYNRLGGDPTGAGSHTLSGGSFGVAGGFDYHVSQDTLLGAALAGGGTNWGLSEGLGGGGSSVLHAGAYGSTRMGPAYLSAAFAFANHWMTTARAAAFGDALSASFDAQTYGGRVEGGCRLATSAGGVTPYAAVQTQSFVTPHYAETGALVGGFGLAYQGRTASDTRTELGAKLDHVVALQPDLALALRGRLAWAHDWVSDPTLLAMFQTLPGAGFLVEGALPVKNAALVSSGVELRFAEGATLSARFDGGFAPRGQSYAGTIGLRYSW